MTCHGCRYHYRARYWFVAVDLCRRTGDAVGLECPLGVIDTEGCRAYVEQTAWPQGAIA